MLEITVRYFAHLREKRGLSEETIRLPAPCTVAELYQQIFSSDCTGIRFAIDATYVDADTMVVDGAEIAFLPPMGGG